MKVEIYSDVICPWCFIGKRRFDQAREQRPRLELDVQWRAFELNPAIASSGMDRQEYLLAKFGDRERLQRMHDQLRDIGTSVGIHFRFDLIRRMPNTRAAHVLLARAAGRGLQGTISEALFSAYFEEGRDVGDGEVLAQLGARHGLDAAQPLSAMEERRIQARVLADEGQAREWGISGVPTFIFDGRSALSGAQPAEVFVQLFDRMSGSVSAA
ncbi:MAG TPA: DsbA family oxidoreductase [Steroidobacteraceae bacterium]|nr:DsbA family oxidoreductase [Steroidobacteraceae bacterium]